MLVLNITPILGVKNLYELLFSTRNFVRFIRIFVLFSKSIIFLSFHKIFGYLVIKKHDYETFYFNKSVIFRD